MTEITILKTRAQLETDRQELRVRSMIQRAHEAVANVLIAEGFDLQNPKMDNDLGIVNFFLKAAIEAQIGVKNEISDHMTETGKLGRQIKL